MPAIPTPASDRDTRPVVIERHDAIDAAGAFVVAARALRRQAGLRRNSGPAMASERRWLRQQAIDFEAAAQRVQRVADDAT
jgi:hypothetical protein